MAKKDMPGKKETTTSRYKSDGYSSDTPSGKSNTYTGQERVSNVGGGRGFGESKEDHRSGDFYKPPMSKKWIEK